jgi:hypothetical protein
MVSVTSSTLKVSITACGYSNGASIAQYTLQWKEESTGTYADLKVFSITETLEFELEKTA